MGEGEGSGGRQTDRERRIGGGGRQTDRERRIGGGGRQTDRERRIGGGGRGQAVGEGRQTENEG